MLPIGLDELCRDEPKLSVHGRWGMVCTMRVSRVSAGLFLFLRRA